MAKNNGKEQRMYTVVNGQKVAKGLKRVLEERGISTDGRNKEWMQSVLSQHIDFKFVPKFHPELNPIERVWAQMYGVLSVSKLLRQCAYASVQCAYVNMHVHMPVMPVCNVRMPVCNVRMSTCMCIFQCAMCICQHACAYASVRVQTLHTRRQHICQCAIWICQHAYVNMLCQHAYAYGNLRMSVCNMYIPQLTTIIMHNYASVGIFL